MAVISSQPTSYKELHLPKMLFLSQDNSTVIYAKTFDGNHLDPALVACSFNAISIFMKNSFDKNSIKQVNIDGLTIQNECIEDINITYVFEGSDSRDIIPEFITRTMDTRIWDMLRDVDCRIPEEVIAQLDLLLAELIV